jgi:rubrerythrin
METIDDKIKPLAILTRAFAFEKETVLFYIGLKEIIGKNQILDEIIKIEKFHVAKLMQYVMTDGQFRGIIDNWN